MFNRDMFFVQFTDPNHVVNIAKKLYEVASFADKKKFKSVKILIGDKEYEFCSIDQIVNLADKFLGHTATC